MQRLISSAEVEVDEGLLRRPGWKPQVSGRDEEVLRWLRTQLQTARREPPALSELREGMDGRDPLPLLRILEREGLVVQVEQDRFYDAVVVAEMMQEIRDGMQDGAAYAPSQLRDLLGVSRKYLMPFLEYCDRQHLTERHQNGRVLARHQAG